jgi:hypothetical protein
MCPHLISGFPRFLMAYSKAKLKAMAINHLILDHFEKETYQASIYPYFTTGFI